MRAVINQQFHVQRKDLFFLLTILKKFPKSIILRDFSEGYKDDFYVPIDDVELQQFISQQEFIINKDVYRFKSIDEIDTILELLYCELRKYQDLYEIDQSEKIELNIQKLSHKIDDIESCLTEKSYGEYMCTDENSLNTGISIGETILYFPKEKRFSKRS